MFIWLLLTYKTVIHIAKYKMFIMPVEFNREELMCGLFLNMYENNKVEKIIRMCVCGCVYKRTFFVFYVNDSKCF